MREFDVISNAYTAILTAPYSEWRLSNQELYCQLRDWLAEYSGSDSETIQNYYENQAILKEDS
jgi:hypothetical protein